MFEYEFFFKRSSFKETNKVKSAKDYIARKKAKCANQTHKGVKKEHKFDFLPGGVLHCN